MAALAATFAIMWAFALEAHGAPMQILGASPAAENSSPEVPATQRLIIHDVLLLVRGRNLQIDPSARPVLDYAVRLLRQRPNTLVFITGKGERETVRLQSQAVAEYLKHQGISADRLILQEASANEASPPSRTNNGVVVLNLTAPACATCPS
jgi:hypothetical protein